MGQPNDPNQFMFGQQQIYGYPTRRNRWWLWMLLIFVIVAVPLAIGYVVLSNVNNVVQGLIGGELAPEMRAVPGDASNFDPLAALDEAQALAGEGAQLASISLRFVRADGTMDLNASYEPYATYEFLREIPAPADAPPVGAGGTIDGQWYEPVKVEAFKPGTRRHVTQISGGVRLSYSYNNEGMVRTVSDPTTNPFGEIVPAPECKFTDLWEVAIAEGAPEDAVALIDYDEDGYTFNIQEVVYLRFNADCTLED